MQKICKTLNKQYYATDHKNNSTYTGFYNDELKTLLEDRISTLNLNDPLVGKHKQTIQDQLTKIFNKYFNQGLEKDDRKNRVVTHTHLHLTWLSREHLFTLYRS